MIEYPGCVKNVDKALNTMGGTSSIEKVFEAQNDRLELKFRKADPLAHAAYGDRHPKKCLMLRITKKKLNLNDTTDTEQIDSKGFEVKVVGRIQTSFSFDTLAEFQWLPMQRTNLVQKINPEDVVKGLDIKRTPESLNPEYVSILDDVAPIKNPFDNTLKNFNAEAPLLILPALFSRFDTPREIHQPHPKFRSQEMRAEFERQQSMAIIGKTRKKRSTMSYLLNFGDSVPDAPPEKLIKEREVMSSQEREMIPKLKNCFEKQKVWTKAGLCFELNCGSLDIKNVLPLVAYYYTTGPFIKMWCKYGYDPHKDQSSKPLQTLDFRIKNPHEQQQYSRRSMNQHQIPLRKNPEKGRNNQQVDLKSAMSNSVGLSQNDPDDMKDMSSLESVCRFRRDTIPQARQLSYQLKDIELEEVQAILHSNDGREPAVCSERDGWLPEGSVDKIRQIMRKTLARTLDNSSHPLQIDQSGPSSSSQNNHDNSLEIMTVQEMETTIDQLYETTL